ncbi:hypothetical protein ABB37_09183 [Leptomonas pyrrhocoris]|uniref:Uncharacterized protein n=1 Tax=Leptomonas pyrrhocoris TaxID=157538 RepID=A0A0N0VD31_LEPPY|nr:hypothetical protein ABB37_09183 [Leptomonas pyrrhocoris]XP_015652968.1 hypothetical protein ABB37_09183 [Leptomonas pyrrhocoris]KPA74528.1 hypothetical protein ABB37_09183 [Leptomonas pyrrhocoris]KPA74529.1 hypothetical protein ABB37_09183 [Leptomonas pyrrhocoris]|eukprot:XP_015652967.1 hypothetical protein ABB37_09183 [Leptomonas pyrrhocoris]
MLRHTLSRWLERKSVRPVMSRAGRTASRPLPTPTATASASPGYRSGDTDDLDGSESLDLMDDIPIEPLGRPLHTSAAAHGSSRNMSAQEMLSRLERKYDLPPAGAQGGVGERRSEAPQEQRSAAGSARRVMSITRRPHSPPSATVGGTDEEAAHIDPAQGSLGKTARTPHGSHTAETMAGTSAGHMESTHEEQQHTASDVGDGAAASSSPTAAKSADAYRFLLNHIDAEIAALQRRHSSVTTRRQSVQTRQTQRIKELFELMEAPWTLLPTEMQPALPATGVDVYIKEQQLARQQRLSGGGSSANSNHLPNAAGHDGQDKMYVLALHKNYKSMPAGRKRFYEEAANYNAAVREEMKYQLTRGCTRFEAFLDRVKECTMEMAREGQMPEMPTGHAQQRFHAQRGASGSRYNGAVRAPWNAASAEGVSAGRRTNSLAGHEASAGEVAAGGETAEGGSLQESSTAVKTGRRKGRRASQRLKDAATTATIENAKSRVAATAVGADSPSPKKAKGKGRHTAPAHAKAFHAAKLSKGKRKTTKAARPAKAVAGGRGGAHGKKSPSSAAAAASPRKSGVSRSIPLPNLNRLALKKIEQIAAPPGKKKRVAAAVTKAAKAQSAGGKKRKR